MAKPTLDLSSGWAETAATDPTSGQDNTAEPVANDQTYGFSRGALVARQWFNWLMKAIWQWIHFFEDFYDAGRYYPLFSFYKSLPGSGTSYFVGTSAAVGYPVHRAGMISTLKARDGSGSYSSNVNPVTVAAGDYINILATWGGANYTLTVTKNGASQSMTVTGVASGEVAVSLELQITV